MDLHRIAVIFLDKLWFFAGISGNDLTDLGVIGYGSVGTAQQFILLFEEATHTVTVLVGSTSVHDADLGLSANSLITFVAQKTHHVLTLIMRAEAHLLDSLHGGNYEAEGAGLQIHLQSSTLVVELADVFLLLVTDGLVTTRKLKMLL